VTTGFDKRLLAFIKFQHPGASAQVESAASIVRALQKKIKTSALFRIAAAGCNSREWQAVISVTGVVVLTVLSLHHVKQ
jgi:hypothetical protein